MGRNYVQLLRKNTFFFTDNLEVANKTHDFIHKSYQIHYVPRECNTEADLLSKDAMDDDIWFNYKTPKENGVRNHNKKLIKDISVYINTKYSLKHRLALLEALSQGDEEKAVIKHLLNPSKYSLDPAIFPKVRVEFSELISSFLSKDEKTSEVKPLLWGTNIMKAVRLEGILRKLQKE